MEIIDKNKEKKLYRSRNRVVGGVCGSLADYFNIDVVVIRIIALLGFGATFWAYIILWLITPLEPAGRSI